MQEPTRRQGSLRAIWPYARTGVSSPMLAPLTATDFEARSRSERGSLWGAIQVGMSLRGGLIPSLGHGRKERRERYYGDSYTV